MKPAKSVCAGGLILSAATFAVAEISKAPPGAPKYSPPVFSQPILPGTNNPPSAEVKNTDDFSALPPGVYRTKPYAGMVKVPEAVHDDIAQRNVPPFTNSMPVVRPELKPVPLGPPGD